MVRAAATAVVVVVVESHAIKKDGRSKETPSRDAVAGCGKSRHCATLAFNSAIPQSGNVVISAFFAYLH